MKKGFIETIVVGALAVALLAGAVGMYYSTRKINSLGTTLPINGSTYTLAGSGVTSSATSFTLTSLTIPQNGYEIVDADASATFYMTIEPGSRTRQEVVSCTTITQNSNNTATISGCSRGLSPISPYTASSTLQFAHSGGSQVIFGDAAQLFNEYTAKANNESIAGTWTFADSPLLTTDCTVASADSEICAKAYIDGVSVAGASNANETTKGIVELATSAEAAAGTSAGATLARLALPASLATSTPGTATGTGSIVATYLGKIKQSFLDLTEAFTWTGLHTFSTGVTSNATTTLAGSNVLSNAIVINTVPYSFPSTQSASSTVLSNNGSGVLTPARIQDIRQRYVLIDGTDLAVTSGNYATSTAAITIPANTLNASSTINVKFVGGPCVVGSGSGTCALYIKTNQGVTLAGGAYAADADSWTGGAGNGWITIGSNGSESFAAQKSAGGSIWSENLGITTTGAMDMTAAISFASDVTLRVVLFGSGGGFTIYSYSIEVNP